MKDKIDIKLVLRAAALIQTKGKATSDDAISYRGLTLRSDYDGYTVVLSNQMVTLTVFFHNKYELKFKNRPARDEFYETLKKITREGAAERLQ